MSLESKLVAYLLNHAGLTALIGNRLYPLMMPEGTALPAVVYQRVSGMREYQFGAYSGMERPRISFSCWGENYGQAKQVASELKTAMQAKTDSDPTITAFVVTETDDFDTDTGYYRVIVDFMVWHNE